MTDELHGPSRGKEGGLLSRRQQSESSTKFKYLCAHGGAFTYDCVLLCHFYCCLNSKRVDFCGSFFHIFALTESNRSKNGLNSLNRRDSSF